MKFEKAIMNYSELKKMGFPEKFLDTIIQMPGQTVATKNGTSRQAHWIFDTEKLQRYWDRSCRGRI